MGEKPASKNWDGIFSTLLMLTGGISVVGGLISLAINLNEDSALEQWIGSANLLLIGTALLVLSYWRKKPEAKSAKYLAYVAAILLWAVVGMMLAVVLTG